MRKQIIISTIIILIILFITLQSSNNYYDRQLEREDKSMKLIVENKCIVWENNTCIKNEIIEYPSHFTRYFEIKIKFVNLTLSGEDENAYVDNRRGGILIINKTELTNCRLIDVTKERYLFGCD